MLPEPTVAAIPMEPDVGGATMEPNGVGVLVLEVCMEP
jgi:hypothetical protein